MKNLVAIIALIFISCFAFSSFAACFNTVQCAYVYGKAILNSCGCQNNTHYNEKKPEASFDDRKMKPQVKKRGWTEQEVKDLTKNADKVEKGRDTRWNPETGKKNDESATMYINKDGHYVVINDKTGDVVQVSDKRDPEWIKHNK